MSTLSIAEQGGILFLAFVLCLSSIVGVAVLLFGKGPQCAFDCFCCLVARVACKKCCGCRCKACNKWRKKLEKEDALEPDDNEESSSSSEEKPPKETL